MASLTAHLRQPGDHGGLPFHAECPVCRTERLAGPLPADAILTRRTQAAVLAGVLAASTAAPATVAAQEPDRQIEGSVAEEQITGADPVQSPDLDPGGESTDLPFDSPVVPQADGASDPDDPLEQEPAADVVAPAVNRGDEPGQSGASEPAPASGATPSPSSAAAGPTDAEAQAPAEAPSFEAGGQAPGKPDGDGATGTAPGIEGGGGTMPRHEGADGATGTAPNGRKGEKPSREGTDRTARAPIVDDASPAPRAEQVAQTTRSTMPNDVPSALRAEQAGATRASMVSGAAPAPSGSAAKPARRHANRSAAGDRDRARPGDRFHVVAAGESLWSIARDLLGRDATLAAVAREVNRLWELNKDRIGTGDPDLVIAGTRLALR